MGRFIAFLTTAMLLGAPAWACNIQSHTERTQVATYVSDALACLATPPGDFQFDAALEQSFVDMINAERREQGLAPYELRAELLPAARFQSLDMGSNDFFAHESLDGRKAADRIAAFDRSLLAQSIAENLAVSGPVTCELQNGETVSCLDIPGFQPPTLEEIAEDLHQRLLGSEGHRENILSDTFTQIAVGVALSESGFYVTQLFANPIGELSAPLPTKLEVNTDIDIEPNLVGWKLGAYMVQDVEDARGDSLQTAKPGEKRLVVVGVNQYEETDGGRTTMIMDTLELNGPAFTLVEATGS
ncbi:MAG: CAP domain-containing protein [Pseudomonadota bacterium]